VIWHFLEVWGLLLAAFAVGCVIGTGVYVVLAATPLAESQAALVDEIDERLAAIGDFFRRRRDPAPDYGLNRELPAYIAPLPIPPPVPHDGDPAYEAEYVEAPPDMATDADAWGDEGQAAEVPAAMSDVEDFLEDVDPAADAWDDDEARWTEETEAVAETWDAERWPDDAAAEEAAAGSDTAAAEEVPDAMPVEVIEAAEAASPDDGPDVVAPEPETVAEDVPAPETDEAPSVPVVAVIPTDDAAVAAEALPPPALPLPPLLPQPEPEPAPTPEREAEADAPVRPLTLPGPRNGVPDNLQRIRGIGQKNEALLNSFGIYHFGQIAAWTPAEARWVASHLAFPERIERDDWIGQAIVIATGGDTGYVKRRRKSDDEELSAAE
jgi:predicted flap endonuclease-1-like 5' DNA nuclease